MPPDQNHAASTIQAAIKRSDVQPIYQNAKQIKHEETANILQQAIIGNSRKCKFNNDARDLAMRMIMAPLTRLLMLRSFLRLR